MARPQADFAERIWKRVDKNAPGGCWLWKGGLRNNKDGYGAISLPGKPTRYRMAHRIVYELLRGPIPEGLELHHKCRIRLCVNPDHLEPITRDENNRHRGPYIAPDQSSRGKPNALKDVCSRCGKPYDYSRDGKRYCLTCIKERQKQDPNRRERAREWKRRNDAAKKAEAIANGTYRAPGSAPGEKRGGGPKKWRTPEYIREQSRLRQQRWRAKQGS